MARIAGIPHVGTIVRQAARCGLGAVMGSKNLKAMVTFGTQKVIQAHEDGLREQMKTVLPHVRKVTETFGKYGTSGGVENYERLGNFPLQNWRASRWADAVKISGVTMHDTILKGRTACLQCPIACGRHIRIEEGPTGLWTARAPNTKPSARWAANAWSMTWPPSARPTICATATGSIPCPPGR